MSASEAPVTSHDPMCMGCGPANPHNLGVSVRVHGDRVRGSVPLDQRHSGAPGFAHGGAIAAILDDLLGSVLILIDRPAVTATLAVDFRAPALLGTDLTLDGWCERIDGRKLHLRGEARQGGELVAEARALFIHVDVSHWDASGLPLPENWQGWRERGPGS